MDYHKALSFRWAAGRSDTHVFGSPRNRGGFHRATGERLEALANTDGAGGRP